jgi:hypothetical protein
MQAHTYFGNRMSPSGAQALAARNLDFLAAIERTIDALVSDTSLVNDIGHAYQELHDKLAGSESAIDADGRINALLEMASETCVRIYRDAQRRHRVADQDPLLQPDDGVLEAYGSFIQAVHKLHDTVEVLREWIATHDAVLQPTTGQTFDSVDDLFESLLSRP